MAYADGTNAKTFARYLERVLVVDPNPAASRLLVELLKDLGGQMLRVETDQKGATEALKLEPQIVIVEVAGPALNGVEFVRQLRRSDLPCRKVPVIMVAAEATAASILAARDAGAHEFLRKPFTIKDLDRRIEAVVLRTRDWVEAVRYIGPDRRRFNSAEYQGPRKRKTDIVIESPAGRIDQAMRILKAGVRAASADPRQALRSMQAQATDLAKVAAETGDAKLASAAAQVREALDAQAATALATGGAPNGAGLQMACQPLWAWLLTGAMA